MIIKFENIERKEPKWIMFFGGLKSKDKIGVEKTIKVVLKRSIIVALKRSIIGIKKDA